MSVRLLLASRACGTLRNQRRSGRPPGSSSRAPQVDTSIFDDLRQDISVVVGASGASHTRSKGSNKLSRTTSGTSIDYSMELRRAKVRRASIIAVTESLESPGTARTRGISWHSPRALPT